MPGQPVAATPAPVASAPASATPAPAASPVAPAGDLDWEATKEANGLYLGKYKTKAEAIKGVGHVVQMAKNAYTRVDAAEQEAARLRAENDQLRRSPAVPVPAAAPTPASVAASLADEPIRSAKLDAVLSKLKDEGGILDEENMSALIDGFSELSDLRATRVVDRTLRSREDAKMAEEQKWADVDAHMQNVAPDSLLFSQEIGLFVRSTPLVAAACTALVKTGQEKAAALFAWQQFQVASPVPLSEVKAADAAKTVVLEAGDQARREALDAARRDAGVIGSTAAGVHETPGAVGPSQEEIDSAVEEMHAGNGTRWRALTIGRTLTDPLFNR